MSTKQVTTVTTTTTVVSPSRKSWTPPQYSPEERRAIAAYAYHAGIKKAAQRFCTKVETIEEWLGVCYDLILPAGDSWAPSGNRRD